MKMRMLFGIVAVLILLASWNAPTTSAVGTHPNLLLPWSNGEIHEVTQQPGGGNIFQSAPADHCCGINKYAWDFDYPNAPATLQRVLAAAPGTVDAIINDVTGSSYDPVTNTCANFRANDVVIKHADGSRAFYLHLAKSTLPGADATSNNGYVKVGDTVQAGTVLGLGGNTGCSTGEHLHFQVDAPDGTPQPVNFSDSHVPAGGISALPELGSVGIPLAGERLDSDNVTAACSINCPPVCPPDCPTTAPDVSVAVSPDPNTAGWNNSPVTIDWTTTPPEATPSGDCATNDPETINFESAGLTRSCTATNGALSTDPLVTRLIKTDFTKPDINGSTSPAANTYGWNNTDVTVHFACNDVGSVQSGISSCTGDQVVSGEGRNQSRSGTAVDVADNSQGATVSGINIDKTPPTTTHTLQPSTPNGKRGWYVSDVTVTLNASDPLLTDGEAGSGVQKTFWRLNGGPWQDYNNTPFVVSNESLDNKVEYYSTDNADNVEATHEFHFKLDKTPPTVDIGAGTIDGITWDQAHLEHGFLTNSSVLNLTGAGNDNLCLWEVRAVDADSGTVLDSEQPAGANVFPPPPPTSLAYTLNAALHTGINNIDVTAEDCAGWTKSIRIQAVYVVPGPFDARSKGFWSNAVKTKKYTNAQMSTLLSYINVASDVWGNDATRNRYGPLTLSNYLTVLNIPNASNMEQKMQAQLLADWLNMVSGKVAIKKGVDVSRVSGWPIVMDDLGGNPLTFAYKVTLDIEAKVQPAPASTAVNSVSKDLAEGLGVATLYTP